MHDPSLRTSRLLIAGGFLAAVAIGTTGFLIGRATTPKDPPTVVVASPSPVVITAPEPEKPRILGRADIIAIADRAADAAASGVALPQDIVGLSGRRFELVIPFGCEGSSAKDSTAPLRWHYDTEKQTLRINVAMTAWQGSDWRLGDSQAGRVGEGFWISRPWSSAEDCPAHRGASVPTDMKPVTLPGQTLAVAQFRAAGETERPPRAFDTVQRVAPEKMDAAQGFRLRLTGRIDKSADGQPVRCIQPAGSEQRPICMVAVSFDELRIEGGKSGDILATWTMSQPAQNN